MAAITPRARRARARRLRASAETLRNRVRLLRDGEAAFPAMLDAIEGARHEILLEMYWFASDATGWRFADALCERARGGVRVRITYDAVGSFEASSQLFDALRAAGCEVHEFHPVAPWRKDFSLGLINRRNHRKLLVVDGALAYTGGINLGDPWASKAEGGQGFRDDAIEVFGQAALDLRRLFFRTWPAPAEPIPAVTLDSSLPRCSVTVLASDLRHERQGIRQGYLDAIHAAREDLIICNSYFIPDFTIRRALFDARERRVRVRVLVPKQSDVPAVKLASRALYAQMFERGIEVYEWRNSVLHAKTAVVDDYWCTVGSFNFDARSLNDNLEINLAVRCPHVSRALRERLEQDLADSEAIDPGTFAARPLSEKVAERLMYGLRWGL